MSSIGSWKKGGKTADSSMMTANHRLVAQNAVFGDAVQYSTVNSLIQTGTKTVTTYTTSIVKGKSVTTATTTKVPTYTNKAITIRTVLKNATTQQHAFNSAALGRANFAA